MTQAQVINTQRAYHCPQAIAQRLVESKNIKYKAIIRLGPMRVHWVEDCGWHLYNRRARLDDILDEYYRLTAVSTSVQGAVAGRVRVRDEAGVPAMPAGHDDQGRS